MEPEPSDNTYALLARYRAGNKAALQTLIQRYYPRVERIVRVRLGAARLARETIADVVQDVFVRIIESAEKFEQRSDARWIDYVARLVQSEISNHACRDGARKRGGGLAREVQRHAESATNWDVPADSTAVHAKVARGEERDLVDACVAALPEAHREVVLLRGYAGCDWKTVADKMGRPSAEACQELYRRACREVRECVQRKV